MVTISSPNPHPLIETCQCISYSVKCDLHHGSHDQVDNIMIGTPTFYIQKVVFKNNIQ